MAVTIYRSPRSLAMRVLWTVEELGSRPYRTLGATRRPWLAADHFTVADLNVAGVLSPSRAQSIDFIDFPRVSDWLQRCYARPAAQTARRNFG